jgi:thiamine pyrophosphate-dependent acetolactate synthase large subunit-like protein
VKELLSHFSKTLRSELPLSYIYLRMAKGMLAMSEEISTEAVADFDVVLAVGQDLGDKDTLAIANF